MGGLRWGEGCKSGVSRHDSMRGWNADFQLLPFQSVVDKLNTLLKERHESGRAISLEEVTKLGTDNPIEDNGFGPKAKRTDLYCIMVGIA